MRWTLTHLKILDFVRDNPNQSMSFIFRGLDITYSHIFAMIRSLRNEGYLEVKEGINRREKSVIVTEKANILQIVKNLKKSLGAGAWDD